MRGDRPKQDPHPVQRGEFTPHARGSTLFSVSLGVRVYVYPACAGIDRSSSVPSPSARSLPRMRGDRPMVCSSIPHRRRFTPHARGSTPSL